MTIDFQIEDVDVGPCGSFSGATVFQAFTVLGLDTASHDGGTLSVDLLLMRSAFLLVEPVRGQLAQLVEHPIGFEPGPEGAVLLCLA